MTHPLDEAYAKVARARTHLYELDRQVAALWEAHPYDIAIEKDPETNQWVVVAKAQRPDEPVPLEFGVVAGDFAHNLRCALNYLAWQLATPPVGTGPGEDTQFPIFFDRPGRKYKLSAADRYRAASNRFLYGIVPEHRARIARVQPFHGGNRMSLYALVALNDRDKHRVITTKAFHMGLGPPMFAGLGDAVLEYHPFPPLYDGAVLARFLSYVPDPGHQVGVGFQKTFAIGFGDGSDKGYTFNLGTLGNATRYVELLLRLFRDVF